MNIYIINVACTVVQYMRRPQGVRQEDQYDFKSNQWYDAAVLLTLLLSLKNRKHIILVYPHKHVLSDQRAKFVLKFALLSTNFVLHYHGSDVTINIQFNTD